MNSAVPFALRFEPNPPTIAVEDPGCPFEEDEVVYHRNEDLPGECHLCHYQGEEEEVLLLLQEA